MAERSIAEMIRPDMRSPDEELQVRSRSLRAARMKAKVEARIAKEQERKVKVEEWQLLRLYPAKEYVGMYFLTERSGGMASRNQWYRFHWAPERNYPEVVLQLWNKPIGREPTLRGEAGDLYRPHLDLPNGETFPVHIIVKSKEAEEDPGLTIQYSVFDLGSLEKGFTVDLEAWQNYLLFREESNKQDLDMRLLYHAVCNRWETGDMTLIEFAQLDVEAIKNLINGMMPGGDYPRPSVREAMLATEPAAPEPTPEMLRAREEEDADLEEKVSENLDKVIRKKFGRRPSFKEIEEYEAMVASNLGKTPRKKGLKHKRLNPYARKEALRFHPEIERKINVRLNKYLEDVLTTDETQGSDLQDVPISVNDFENPKEVMNFIKEKTSPDSPWSGSGWATEEERDDTEDPDEDEPTMVPLDQDGRMIPASLMIPPKLFPEAGNITPPLKPERSWEESYKAQKDVNLVLTESREERHDETVLSLMSSMSGIDMLDRSSELESIIRDAQTTSSDDSARFHDLELNDSMPDLDDSIQDLDESIQDPDDSVEVFLAKHRESEIVTLDSSSSSGGSTPGQGPMAESTTSPGPSATGDVPEITYQGSRYKWTVSNEVAFYPGAYIDDLVAVGIPPELWPFKTNEETDDAKTEECCHDYKQKNEEKN